MEAKNLILCPRCSYWTPKDREFCWKCGKTLPRVHTEDPEEDVDTVIAPQDNALLAGTTITIPAGVLKPGGGIRLTVDGMVIIW